MNWMSVETLLDELKKHNVEFIRRDGVMKLKAPPGSLSVDLKKNIARHREALLHQAKENDRAQPRLESPIPMLDVHAAPLSFAQQRIWFVQKLQDSSVQFNVSGGFRIQHGFDSASFEATIRALLRRHSALRSVFCEREGAVLQKILEDYELPIEMVKVSGATRRDQQEELARLSAVDAQIPFKLDTDLPIRIKVASLGQGEHAVLFSVHHLVVDGISISILLKEFGELYRSFRKGVVADLPELPLRYVDFAMWQRKAVEAGQYRDDIAYWRDRLSEAPEVHSLPIDRPRNTAQSNEGGVLQIDLVETLSTRIIEFCRVHQVTPSTFFHAVYTLWLARMSDQKDVVVGYPTSGRHRSEFMPLVGLLLNTLLLKVEIPDEITFLDHLDACRNHLIQGMRHQEMPYELLVDDISPKRDLAHNPLYQLWFNYQDQSDQVENLSDYGLGPLIQHDGDESYGPRSLSLTSASARSEGIELAVRNELHFDVTKHGEFFSIDWIYNKALFDRSSIDNFNKSFINLLSGVLNNSQNAVGAIALVSDEDRHRLLHEWSKGPDRPTVRKQADQQFVHEILEGHVLSRPDSCAIRQGDSHLSFREFWLRVNRLAHLLVESGVKPDVPVGVCLRRSPGVLIALFAIMKAGGAFVPLEPDYPSLRLKSIIEDSGLKLCLTSGDALENLPLDGLNISLMDGFEAEDWLAEFSESSPEIGNLEPSHLAYIIYTSGSSGQPKGVMVEHHTLAEYMQSAREIYYSDALEGSLHLGSHCFDLSLPGLILPLLTGGCVVLAQHGAEDVAFCEGATSGLGLLHRITPTHLSALISSLGPTFVSNAPHVFVIGGEPLSQEFTERLLQQFPKARVFNHYGPTEATIGVSYYEVERNVARAAKVPIGRPLGAARLLVLLPNLDLAPIGCVGELHIGGPVLARGYSGSAAAIENRFVSDLFSDEIGARLYRTGDLVRYREDGNLEFVGRKDDQIKVRGFRVEPGEVESALRRLSGVSDAYVGLDKKDGRLRLVGYLAGAADGLTSDLVRSNLRSVLPDFMVPDSIVIMNRLPRKPNGKLDRAALPAPETKSGNVDICPPTTGREIALCAIWQECLGVEKVGLNDNFFELGGDSIMSLQVVARAKQLGISCTVRQLFEHQTVGGLLSSLVHDAIPSESIDPSEGEQTLLPIQREFFRRSLPDPHHYNQSLLIETPPDLRTCHLEAFADELMRNHDVFRLRFEPQGKEWRAHYGPLESCLSEGIVRTLNLEGLPIAARPAALEHICSEIQVSMALNSAPLLRMAYFDYGPRERGRLFITAHHLVVDGVSWRIILSSLESSYRLKSAEIVENPRTGASYQQWGSLLAEHASSARTLDQKHFWLTQLDGPSSLPLVSCDGDTAGCYRVEKSLAETDTHKLLTDCNRAYKTVGHELLLAALLVAYRTCSLFDGLSIYVESHGREASFTKLDLSACVGWFTSIYPLALSAPPGADLGEVIKSTKERCRQVSDSGIGFGLLTEISDDQELRDAHARRRAESILFNYLGKIDGGATLGDLFKLAPEPVPAMRAPSQRQLEPLAIVLWVHDNSLHFSMEGDTSRLSAKFIDDLAESYCRSLRSIIDWCAKVLARDRVSFNSSNPAMRERLSSEGISI